MPFRPAEKYRNWWIEKVRDGAGPQLSNGETIKAGTYGQEVGSYWMSIVCFWKPRLIVVTDASVLLFKSGVFNSAKVGELLERSPLSPQSIERNGHVLQIAGHKIVPPPGAGRETDEVISATLVAAPPPAVVHTPQRSTAPPSTSIPPPA